MTFSAGETVGPYRIIEPLGQGGMATVYKAYHAALDRYVAIKVLHPAFKEDPNFLARFNREARIVARLDHTNIVPIYDFAEHEGTPYLVLRYVEGKTLKTILREGQLPIPGTVAIMRPVTAGLAYAHAQGILHRDIKPSNIIIATDGHVYLADFGLARIAQAGESSLSQDMLIGTPQYISPEQARGVSASERSDLYSLGVVLFEMLTGRVPFSADTPYAVIHDHIYTPLPLPTLINPNLAPEIERVLLKALAKEPDARFATALDLMTAFERASASVPRAMPEAPVSPVIAAPAATLPPAPVLTDPTAQPVARNEPVSKPLASKPKRRLNWITYGVIGALACLTLLCLALSLDPQSPVRQLLQNVPPRARTPDPERIARDMVNANPQDPAAHVQLANALAQQKNYDAAFTEYDQALKLNPKSSGAYLRAGELAKKQGELERAVKYYKAGIAALPDDQNLMLNLADVHLAQKKYDDARALVERVLKDDAGNAQALWRLGDVERAQGKLAEALRDYTRAVAADPNLPQAHYGLGMLALNRGATDEAKRQFQIVVNNPETPSDLRDQANQQLRQLGGK